MADITGLQTLVSALQNVVVNIGALTKQIAASTSAIFPQTQGTATTATAGAIASPGNFAGFIDVKLPNGTTVKVGYFNV
jgi:hypothetical protein